MINRSTVPPGFAYVEALFHAFTRIVYWDKFGRPDLPEEVYIAPFPDGWWFDEEKAARIKF